MNWALPRRNQRHTEVAPQTAPSAQALAADGGPGSRAAVGRRDAATLVVLALAALGPVLESVLDHGRGWMAAIVIVTLAPSFLRAGGVRLHPLDPETFVPFAYFLASAYAALIHLADADWSGLDWRETQTLAVAYAGAVGCAVICTAFSRVPAPRAPDAPNTTDVKLTSMDRAVLVLAAIAVVMLVAQFATIGLSNLEQMSYVETYVAERGLGILVGGWLLIQLCVAYLVARAVSIRASSGRVPGLMIVGIVVLTALYAVNTVLGRRGPIIWLAVSTLLTAHISGVRVRRIWLMLAVVGIVVYSFAVEGARTSLGEGLDAEVDAAETRMEHVHNPLAIPELETVFNNAVVVVNDKPPLVDYPGESWVSAFLQQIPVVVWPGRPLAMSERYVMWSDPFLARAGGGLGFNAAAEGYMNLGTFGAFIQVLAMTFGFFFGPISACISRARSPLFAAFACCLTSYAYNQFRAELASMLKVTIIFGAGLVAVTVMTWIAEELRHRAVSVRRSAH